jgi:hypothetical protein
MSVPDPTPSRMERDSNSKTNVPDPAPSSMDWSAVGIKALFLRNEILTLEIDSWMI